MEFFRNKETLLQMKIVSIYSTLKIVSIIVQKSAMVLSQIYTPGQKVIHF